MTLALQGRDLRVCRCPIVARPREAFGGQNLGFWCSTCGQNDFFCGMWYRMLCILLVCGESHNDHMAFYSVSAMLVLEAVFLVEVLFSGLVFGRR